MNVDEQETFHRLDLSILHPLECLSLAMPAVCGAHTLFSIILFMFIVCFVKKKSIFYTLNISFSVETCFLTMQHDNKLFEGMSECYTIWIHIGLDLTKTVCKTVIVIVNQ